MSQGIAELSEVSSSRSIKETYESRWRKGLDGGIRHTLFT